MARAIFISYRRDDSEGEAGRLYDDLARTFGEDSVFMDVAGIDPGTDFRTAIDSNVASCGVLLAILGPRWATVPSPAGTPRLEDANDFVRLEIASALKRNIPVIPVLVHEAKMPHPDLLPDALKDLAYRNSVEITHARWNSDVQLLTRALAQYVNSTRATATQPVHATVSVQLPAPYDATPARPASARSRTPLYAGLALLAIVAASLAAFFAFRHTASPPAPAPLASTSTTAPSQAVAAVGPSSGAPAATPPASSPAPAPGATAMLGTWVHQNVSGANRLARLSVSQGPRDQLLIHAWGNCQPSLCDWGAQPAPLMGASATAIWPRVAGDDVSPNPHMASVTVTPEAARLRVHLVNTGFRGGRAAFGWLFVPEPPR